MNDRELLEMAAKTVGVMLEWDGPAENWKPMYYQGKTYLTFNPLEDDGDAFRLMVELDIAYEPVGSANGNPNIANCWP